MGEEHRGEVQASKRGARDDFARTLFLKQHGAAHNAAAEETEGVECFLGHFVSLELANLLLFEQIDAMSAAV